MTDGTGIPDGPESHLWHGQESSSPEPTVEGASLRSHPGILIFSRRRQLLHMNRRALELTGQLDQADAGAAAIAVSRTVSELRTQIQTLLDSHREADIRELFELKRVIEEGGRKIQIRGFGLTDQYSYDDSRIVILVDEAGFRQEQRAQ